MAFFKACADGALSSAGRYPARAPRRMHAIAVAFSAPRRSGASFTALSARSNSSKSSAELVVSPSGIAKSKDSVMADARESLSRSLLRAVSEWIGVKLFRESIPDFSHPKVVEPRSNRSRAAGNRRLLPLACRATAEIFPSAGVRIWAITSCSRNGTTRNIADGVVVSCFGPIGGVVDK
jgi:hypothetical protein